MGTVQTDRTPVCLVPADPGVNVVLGSVDPVGPPTSPVVATFRIGP
jgi:hypothetical protein